MSDLQMLGVALVGPAMILGGLLGYLSGGTANKRFAGTVVMLSGFAIGAGTCVWMLSTM